MNIAHWMRALRAWLRFRTYRPVKITPSLIMRWLAQYPKEARGNLLSLLEAVEFLDERYVERALVEKNGEILNRLRQDDIDLNRVVYVQHGDAASSSPVMLNLLRDRARIERSGATFIDSRDQDQLSEVTTRLNQGALIYVDDFSCTGDQFVRNRNWTAQFIAGSFSEFFLTVAMCEEALAPIEAVGVVPICSVVDYKVERPLHEECDALNLSYRDTLMELGREVSPKWPLGYRNVGSKTVLYRNAPNTTPVLLRGHIGQTPRFGVMPRSSDLR